MGQKRCRQNRKGFTLIEIMIVIVILAILMMIMIPSFAKSRYEANLSSCESNERNLAAALENYHTSEGFYPSVLDANFLSTYMAKAAVNCPTNGANYTYQVSTDFSDYTIACGGGLHYIGLPGVVSNGFPQFSPGYGQALH